MDMFGDRGEGHWMRALCQRMIAWVPVVVVAVGHFDQCFDRYFGRYFDHFGHQFDPSDLQFGQEMYQHVVNWNAL